MLVTLHCSQVNCIYNGILLSHSKDEILPFASTWMDLEGIMLIKINKIKKDKYHMISLMWNEKSKTKPHQTHRGRHWIGG